MPDSTANEQVPKPLEPHIIDNLERRAHADIAAGGARRSSRVPASMLLSLIAELRASREREAGTVTLFHRTTPEAAREIHDRGTWLSSENTQEVYLSDRLNGAAVGYGAAVVVVTIPPHLAQLEDEFPDGERHYRVRIADLRPEYVAASSDKAGA